MYYNRNVKQGVEPGSLNFEEIISNFESIKSGNTVTSVKTNSDKNFKNNELSGYNEVGFGLRISIMNAIHFG